MMKAKHENQSASQPTFQKILDTSIKTKVTQIPHLVNLIPVGNQCTELKLLPMFSSQSVDTHMYKKCLNPNWMLLRQDFYNLE